MVRKTLLATSALVLGTSIAFAGPLHKIPARKAVHFGTAGHVVKGFAVNLSVGNTKNLPPVHNNKLPSMTASLYSNFSKSANALFISWYGFRVENSAFSSYYSSHDFFKDSEVANNAVKFTTAGGALKSMAFGGFAYQSTAEFQGEILSASSGGLPGSVIAHTASTTESDTALCCTSLRTVKFKPVGTLPAGTYFASVVCANSPCDGGWGMEDSDFSGATKDYFHANIKETYNFGSGIFTYHSSLPWHSSTYYPTAGATMIK